jgi:hypothetical protein
VEIALQTDAAAQRFKRMGTASFRSIVGMAHKEVAIGVFSFGQRSFNKEQT